MKENAAENKLISGIKRLNAPLNKKQPFGRQYLLCLIYTALVCFIMMFAFKVRYEVNDDAFLANIANGAYGPNSQYLININIVYGLFLKLLYALPGAVNWFVVFPLVLSVFVCAYLGVMLFNALKKPLYWFLAYTFPLMFLGLDLFVRFHHIRFAAFFCLSGLCIIICNLGRFNKAYFLGLALVSFGSMFRFEMFVAVGGISAGWIIYKFIGFDKQKKQKTVLGILILLCSAFGFYFANKIVYSTNAEWAKYVQFDKVRKEIVDFRIDNLSAELMLENGYSENDYQMIANWLFYDADVFSNEELAQIRDIAPRNSIFETVRAMRSIIVQTLTGNTINSCLSAIILLWLFFSKKKKWPVFVMTLVFYYAMVFYLTWRGRYIVRIDWCLTVAAAVFLLMCFDELSLPSIKMIAFSCALLSAFNFPQIYVNFVDSRNYHTQRSIRAVSFDKYSQDKQTLYLVDSNLMDIVNGYNVWQARPKDYFSNIVTVGSWYMYAPFEEETLNRYGVQNPFKDAVDAANVKILDGANVSVRQAYYHEHYGNNISLEKTGDEDFYSVYRVVTLPVE